MSDTPETDEQINGKPCARFGVYVGDSLRDAWVASEFARKLERERDRYKSEVEVITRERDEAREALRKLSQLVHRLFALLETVEVSDSEREFHPTRIQSCRVMHTIELGELLPKLKEAAK